MTVPIPLQRARKRRIVRQFVVGCLLTFTIIATENLLEKNGTVRAAVEYSYDHLQAGLSPVKDKKSSIVVVDFSDILLETNPGALEGEPYTPREKLRSMIEGIFDQGPRAIGLDVDFSLSETGEFFNPDDQKFLDFCLSKRGRKSQFTVSGRPGGSLSRSEFASPNVSVRI